MPYVLRRNLADAMFCLDQTGGARGEAAVWLEPGVGVELAGTLKARNQPWYGSNDACGAQLNERSIVSHDICAGCGVMETDA